MEIPLYGNNQWEMEQSKNRPPYKLTWCFDPFHLCALSPTWANSHPPTVAQSISPPRRCQSMTFEKVRIVGLLTNV